MTRVVFILFIPFLAGSAGCVNPGGFTCTSDAVCMANGVSGGRCEPTLACSFIDPTCPSGRRYGGVSAPTLADRCLGSETDAPASVDGGALPANILPNPSFETNLVGWDNFNATLMMVPGGHAGAQACRVCSLDVDYTIDDEDSIVPSTPAGVTFVAAAWVRLPAGQPSQTITLVIRERQGGNGIDSRAEVVIDSQWRELRTTHMSALPGSRVDLYIGNLVGQGCFDIDDVTFGTP